jgi:ABC-type transport system involved in cytochrome bd biosynthesis fused ATPase/permease subunit
LYVWTIIPPLFALLMLYSIILHPTNDLTVAIIVIIVLSILPFVAWFYGQAAKNELKNVFVGAFKLVKA